MAFLPWAHAFGQTAELFVLLHSGATLAINDEISRLSENLARIKPTVIVAVPRIFNRIYAGVSKQLEQRPRIVRSIFDAGIRAGTRIRQQERQNRRLPTADTNIPSLTERFRSSADTAIYAVADRLFFAKVRARLGGRVRFAISGSAALSVEVAQFIDALGIDVFEGYGLTEASPVVSANYEGHHKMGSVGLPFSGVEVLIDIPEGSQDTSGEIVVRGPNVMMGYHNRPEETQQVLLPEGSLRTGDLGYLDAEGYLYITGRIKEQYKLENGRYIAPSPLEEQLKLSPLIDQVMLYGANRPYNVALVVPDWQALIEALGGTEQTPQQLSSDRRAKELLQGELNEYGHAFKSYEQPRDLAIAVEDFTQGNGMLTPSLKLRRPRVLETYEPILEALY